MTSRGATPPLVLPRPSGSRLTAAVIAAALLVAGARAPVASAQVVVRTEPEAPLPTPTPNGTPPPGAEPRYVYAPAPVGSERAAMLGARLLELQTLRDQQRVGGPIAMVVIGSVVGSFSALATMGFGLARSVSSDDFGPRGTNLVRGSRVCGGLLVGSVVMIGVGSAKLGQRRRARGQIDSEIFRIHQELRMLQWNGVGLRLAPEFAVAEVRFAF